MGLFFSCVFCGEARSAAPRYFTLHIESQPLDGALLEFARQTGLQVLFFSRLTEGQQAPALDGMYTLDAAMTELLSMADLKYRTINARTIEIVPAHRTGAGPRIGKADAFCT